MKRIFTLLSFMVCSTLIFAQPLVSTWVGTGVAGHITGNNSRTITLLDMPYGVAMDQQGNLWLSEEGGNGYGHDILIVQPSGNTSARAGATGDNCFKNASGITSKFSQPRGLAIDANDNIYVADYGNCVIRKISTFLSIGNSQIISTYAGKNDSTFTGSCYPTYCGYADGTLKTAQFNGPSDIAIDKTTGAMYVADAENNCIRKIYNGQVTTVAGHPDSMGFRDGTVANAKFNKPTGIYVASNGDIYVADHSNQRIRKISGGTVSTVVPLSAGLWAPDDVWVLANGDLLITDFGRIRKYSGTTLTTFAGSNTDRETGDTDGYGTNARFNSVKCIVADNSNSGIFFVADQENHKIKKVVSCAAYKPLVTISGQQKNDSTFATCTGDTIDLEVKAVYPSYKWSTGETTSKIIITSSVNNITCTVTNTDGCQGTSDHFYINISDLSPKITLNGPTTFCPGDSVLLSADNGYNWYKWIKDGITYKEGPQGDASGIYVSQKNLGRYKLTLTLGACVGTSAEIIIATSTSIVPSINIIYGDTNLCANDSLLVETPGNFDTYSWMKDGTPTSSTKSLKIKTPGVYTVSVTQAGGCSGTSYPMHVVILPSPPTPSFTVSHDTLWSSVADAYQWYLNNVKIPGETKRGYIATQSGSYSVEVGTTANSCKSRSLPQNVILSILELSGGLRFDVYPNPTTGKLIVSGTFKTSGDFNIRVVNMLGKSVYNNNMNLIPGRFEKEIDLQGNTSGIYFVIISSNGKQGMMKLILR